MRINKYLSDQGFCSRREADRLIASGKVRINGRVAKLGDQVEAKDEIVVIGHAKTDERPERVYILLHKPVGYITTTDRKAKDNVLDLVPSKARLFPVGRLDVASSGLLLLTNDGELANKLTHPRYEHEKEYEVRVEEPLGRSPTGESITDAELDKLARGVTLDDGPTLPAKIKRLATDRFTITIREGRNRQVRRMCAAIGHEVRTLKRIRLGSLELGELASGKWRELTAKEIKALR